MQQNGRSPPKPVKSIENGNSLNKNHDIYNTDLKTNGNDRVEEDDPLTGPKKSDEEEATTEPNCRQRFATTNFFMVIFLLAYVLQGNKSVF